MNFCIVIWLAIMVTMAAGEGSVKDYRHFNAHDDARSLRSAMRGWGTDEDRLTDIISSRSNRQRQQIKTVFAQAYGRNLISDLQSETSGLYEKLLVALMTEPLEYDATCLRLAMRGLGTRETVLIEILASRSNSDINEINRIYKPNYSIFWKEYRAYDRKLEAEMQYDLSGLLERLLVGLNYGHRNESSVVVQATARSDAFQLHNSESYSAGDTFSSILNTRSHAQLRATFQEYQRLSGVNIEQTIKQRFSGYSRDVMLAIVQIARDPPTFFAKSFYKAMDGMGTQDDDLIRLAVTRSEVDMQEIKQRFYELYNISLHDFTVNEVSGDYKKLLLNVIN